MGSYWMLCVLWALPTVVLVTAFESVLLPLSRDLLKPQYVHWCAHTIAALVGFLAAGCYHGGLAR